MRMRHIVICGLYGSTEIFHIISYKTRVQKKKVTEHKMCFDYLFKYTWNFSHFKKNWARYD
jgi:hypothetical protein